MHRSLGRVERLDGEIRVHSRPGAGTTLRMIVPTAIAKQSNLLDIIRRVGVKVPEGSAP